MERTCVRLADAVYSSSACSVDWCARYYGLAREHVPVLHTGVDTQLFRPGAASKERRPTIVFVGKVEPAKGIDVLVEATCRVAQDYPDVQLRIIGEGDPDFVQELRAQAAARDRPDLLEFTGFVRSSELPAHLNRAHILAGPSVYEGGPGFVYLEAMACGLPVIASRGSGAAEAVRDQETGLLVPPRDVDALAVALGTLLGSPDLRREMGARGRSVVNAEADSRLCLKRLEDFYRSVCDSRRVSVPIRPTKGALTDLAIFGGRPAFEEKVHVGRPNIGDQDRLFERINSALSRRWLSNDGPYVLEFEARIAELLGAKHCISTCNGTVALELGIRALDLTGEVIVPSFTFVATAQALKWLGLTPVFCDVDPGTHNIDPREVERLITPRTTGILGVHLWGRPCDVDRLEAIASRNRIALFFDAAHAFGCSRNGRMVGTFGSLEAFSFHATKFLHTFEGGAVVTDDDALAARLRAMRNFGFTAQEEATEIGTNAKMNEISAAMGLTGLDSFADVVAANASNYRRYRRELDGLLGVQLVPFDEREGCNFQYVVAEVDEDVTGVSRDELLEVLKAENVLARRYFYPGCHRMPAYHSEFPEAGSSLPVTEALANRVLVLPTGTAVTPEDVAGICAIIRLAVAHGGDLHAQLADRARRRTPPPRVFEPTPLRHGGH
jgi:dTDP-4-amino-4,6-dideoxygalactose transaminase